MGRSPRCNIPTSMEIGPLIPVKRILKGFHHILAWQPSWSCDQHHINKFSFQCTQKLTLQNLVKTSPVVSEKSIFSFSYINGLGPRSRNDLDLQYSHTFINSIICLHLPTFRSLAAIVSDKSIVFTFSHRKT